MKPRYYQHEAVNALWDYFYRNPTGNPLLALPTGTGKSIIIAMFIWEVLSRFPGQRIMMLTHVQELIEQNFEKLVSLWPTVPAGIYSAGLGRRDTAMPITFAGIDSVTRRPKAFGHQDLVIIDEAHLVAPKTGTRYQKFIRALSIQNPNIRVIGLTATPYRLGLGLLTEGGLFDDIAYDLTTMQAFNRLVAEGYLAPLITKRTGTELDVSGVHMAGGEFKQTELQAAVDKDEVTYAAVKEILEQGHDRKHWLLFAAGIAHAEHITAMLESLGVPAAVVHSKLSREERREAITGFKVGRYRALVNNNVLTTGFDFPGIDLIGMLRPTSSTGLWVQMLGRGTRPAPGKANCLVLDFAGNTRRLGPINDPVLPRAKGKKAGTAPIRVCESCGAYNHASVRYCVNCGIEFPRQIKIMAQAGTEQVMADGLPQVEVFKVGRVTYSKHTKPGRPPSLKVSYFCGLRLFQEWVCLEHEGLPGKKGRDWWRKRVSEDQSPPETIDDALPLLNRLATPTHIRVWVNKKYPEILSHDFTGKGFAQEYDDEHEKEQADVLLG